MARKPRTTTPSSVILTHEQKAFVKKEAAKADRSFSHQLRWIINSWCDFTRNQEKSHGKESQKAEEVGQ